MQYKQDQTVLTPALLELFKGGWQKHRVIYFGAPCGFGKTTAARALLAGRIVCERSAMQPDKLAQPIPDGCDAILVDDVQMLQDAADQQAVCAWINENPGRHVVLLGRGELPGWLMPYRLTGLLMQIESAQLMFDRAATAALLEKNGVNLSAEELTALQNDSAGYPLVVSILSRRMAGGRPYSDRMADEARREMFFHFETAVYRRFSPPMRRLLVSLAPFETFDAELAKLVSGDSHVNELLSQLLHETSMLLYDNIETYRFWPAFRKFLLWELRQDCTTEQQDDIYRRAETLL
jgi:LuxR family maltose regulon positive regulatory protein